MSWVAVGLGAVQLGYGIYQNVKGSAAAKEAEANRPEYKIPLSLQRALASAQLRSLQGLPGAVKSEMLQEMDRSRMASLAQINERRGGLGAISQLEQTQQDSIRQIGLMDVQQRDKNLQNLQQLRTVMAQQEQQAWQWNEAESYKAAAGAASAMQGAGLQNIAGGVTSIASVAASGAFKKKGAAPTDADSIEARGKQAAQYGLDVSEMEYNKADNKWIPTQGTVNPNDATQVWGATGWGAPTTNINNTPVNTEALNAAATQHGVTAENLEELNGKYYPISGAERSGEGGIAEVWDNGKWAPKEEAAAISSIGKISSQTTGVSAEGKTVDDLIAEGFTLEEAEKMITSGAYTGEQSQEVITSEGELAIVDANNNGIPDNDEKTLASGETIQISTGNVLVTAEENASITNQNDQINIALQNSENIDLSLQDPSLKGQVSEANQIAAAQTHGVDRGDLELVDGNWVPKHGITNTEGLIYDSSAGEFIEAKTQGQIDEDYVVPAPTKVDVENEFLKDEKGEIILDKNNNPTKNPDYDPSAVEGDVSISGAPTGGPSLTATTTTWRDNKEIDSTRVDRFGVQGSAGKNKANVLKDGKPIEVEVMGGIATVTGVRAEGNELIVDVQAPLGQGGAKDMGKFVESEDGYKFEPNQAIYGQLKGEDKKDFDAFIKAVESDPEFAKQLLASVTGETDFNPSEYGKKKNNVIAESKDETREEKHIRLNKEYEASVASNVSDKEGYHTSEYINETLRNHNATINENGSITIYPPGSKDKKAGEIITIEDLLSTQGKERANRILGTKQKRYKFGTDGSKTIYQFGTVEMTHNEDGSQTETITITAKNHPLSGKTYIRKSVDNPEKGSKKVIEEAASLLTEYTTSEGSPIDVTYFHTGRKDFDIDHITRYIDGYFKKKDGSAISGEDKKRLIKEMEKLYGRWWSHDVQTVKEQK